MSSEVNCSFWLDHLHFTNKYNGRVENIYILVLPPFNVTLAGL